MPPDQPSIRRRPRKSQRRRDGLLKYAKDNTSQSGEDGIISRIFHVLPPPPDGKVYRCVDVGAWDGKHLSNTYSLLVSNTSNQKWRGVLIEPDVQRFRDLRALYEPLQNICLKLAVSGLPHAPQSLVNILSEKVTEIDLSGGFDFLCIDIDGSDYWVLSDLLESKRFRPRVICIEFNPTMPVDLVYIPPRNDAMRHGASVSALVELAETHNYTLVETTLYNAFFVETSLFQAYLRQEVPDTSIEALHEPTMATSLYQLYDGTIKLWGCKRMLWHRIPMDESKIQMLSKEERQFPFAPSESDTFDFGKVVDLSPFFSLSDTGRAQSSKALVEHLRRDGFVYVRGLPIGGVLARNILESTHALLQTADEGVRRSCLTKDRARRGYSAMCTENFASLIGEEGPNDLVRKFRVGPESGAATSSALWQPNIWPAAEIWEHAASFRETVGGYFDDMSEAARHVVKAICEGLLVDDATLADSLEPLLSTDSCSHTSILTLLGYKTGTRHRGKNKGPLVAPHTDVGVATILIFDQGDCAVLQRSDGSGGWIDVELPKVIPDDPVFVVNIGDCFSDLTGKKLPSTLHRVATKPGSSPRNCCALFVGLDPSQRLQVEGKSMTYEEWRKRRIARAQEVLKKKSLPT